MFKEQAGFRFAVVWALLLLVLSTGCASEAENPAPEGCPLVLRSDSPTLETPEGKFTLDRVEVWTAADCLGEPESGGEKTPGYLFVFSWTNTGDVPVTMGANSTPLYPVLLVGDDSSDFIGPVIPQSMEPYETVAPGDSVIVKQWHYPREEGNPRIPDEVLVTSISSFEDYGQISISPPTE